MKTVVITGSQGFIGGYLCRELLAHDYRVVGIDNFSKYGPVKRDYDDHENFHLVRWDLSYSWPGSDIWPHSNPFLGKRKQFLKDAEYIIAGAAMIGGISYFHKYAYDLLITNERITGNTMNEAVHRYKAGRLKRLIMISSSMVYEGADNYFQLHNERLWPTDEDSLLAMPPPMSTYGFQKLATEYFCKGAQQQYGLPYTIVRPFNCVGIGEDRAIGEEEVYSGNVKLQMSHVLPDLINKVLSGQDPLHIFGNGRQIRCYTHGKDIARGIRLAMESERAENQEYNISTSRQTIVKELAEIIWKKVHGDKPLTFIHDKSYTYDVQKRIPDVSKALEHLDFESEITLEESVSEVIDYMTRSKFQNV